MMPQLAAASDSGCDLVLPSACVEEALLSVLSLVLVHMIKLTLSVVQARSRDALLSLHLRV